MTVRLYLTNSAAPISPAFSSAWESSGSAIRGTLGLGKAGTNTTTAAAETSTSGAFDVALGQWSSPPLTRAGTLSGLFAGALVRLESDAAANLVTRYVVRVTSGDGTTVRGTALDLAGASEWETTLTTFAWADLALTPVAYQVGDRIVVELGYRATNVVSTSYTGTMLYGGTQAPELNGGSAAVTITASPWVQFDSPGLDSALIGVPFLQTTLGASARVAVEAAFGADLAVDEWAWTDITTDVRQGGGQQITYSLGRTDESSVTNPSQCSMTLDNTTGAYSLGGQSPNWPNVRRNTPVRVRVDPDGTGYVDRFVGFADSWVPSWDVTGNDAVVKLSASGTLRRLKQGKSVVVSPFRRAMLARTDVRAYWPCEELKGATAITSGLSGGTAMHLTGDSESPYPKFEENDAFPCSRRLPLVNLTSWRGVVPTYTGTGQVQLRWLMACPQTSLSATECVVMRLFCTGTASRWDVSYVVGGNLKVNAYNTSGAQVVNTSIGFASDDTVRWCSLELTQTGGDVAWRLNVIGLGYAIAGGFGATLAGYTISAATSVAVGPNLDVNQAAIGHVTVYSAVTTFTSDLPEFNSYDYEEVGTRLARLCAENDVPLTIVGTATTQMGPQAVTDLVALLRECETVDQGILYDGASAGLTYVTGSQRVNATAALTLNAAAGELARDVAPADDDQRNVNKALATRTFGGTALHEDTDGPLGTAAVGIYDDTITTNIAATDDIVDYASWLVHLGTVEGYRYPELALDLAHDPGLAPTWVDVTPSGRVDVTGVSTVRTQHPTGTLSLLVEGYAESLDQFRWGVDLNVSPFEPWRVGLLAATSGDTGGNVLRVESDGSTLSGSVSAGATSLSVATAVGPLWSTAADDCPMTIDVGGIPITVTAISGASSPQTFTVTGATVTKALATGLPVALYRPVTLGV